MTRPLLAVALALGLAAATPARALEPRVEVLPDGVELVTLPVRGAKLAALQVVVRAGSAWDPPTRSGLAHLVEHALLEGPDAQRLVADVREVAGTLNGFTTRDATRFVLSAPLARFPALAGRLLRLLTSPSFAPAAVDAAFGVVAAENAFRALAPPQALVEDAVFRLDLPAGAPGAGSKATRADLIAFYVRHYGTRDLTVVVAGDLTPARARELVLPAVLLPPALPGERTTPRPSTPVLPLAQRVRAGVTATVLGWQLDPADRAACADLADLAALRLSLALQVRDPAASAVDARCEDLRGAPYLLAVGYTRAAAEGDLPARVEAILQGLATAPASERERRVVSQRRARTQELLAADPEALAEAAALLAARPRIAGETAVAELSPPPPAWRSLPAVARRAFVRERSLRLTFTPFQE
jgi:predicted Zn-dependent peptidase